MTKLKKDGTPKKPRKAPANLLKHSWKKGQSGNPKGPPPGLTGMIKKLTRSELEDIAGLVIKGDVVELKKLAKDPTTQVLKAMFASVCIRAIEQGNMTTLDALLDRLIGKVAQQTHLTSDGSIAAQAIPLVTVTLPSNGREAPINKPAENEPTE